jgi:hypothetical protein
MLAAVIEQALPDFFPSCMRAVQANRVSVGDLDGAPTSDVTLPPWLDPV